MPEQDRKEMVLFCASGHQQAEMFKSRQAVFPGCNLRVSLYRCPVCGEEAMNPCLVFSTLEVPVEYQTVPEADELYRQVVGVIVFALNIQPQSIQAVDRLASDLSADSTEYEEIVLRLDHLLGTEMSCGILLPQLETVTVSELVEFVRERLPARLETPAA